MSQRPWLRALAAGEDSAQPVVLDTNVVLDLYVFADPATELLRDHLACGALRWIATRPMRDELERVLAYPHLAARLASNGTPADHVLQAFDALAQLQPVPDKVPLTCKDADDQKFIDLAVAHRARMLSKDKAVLTMARRMQLHGVQTGASYRAA